MDLRKTYLQNIIHVISIWSRIFLHKYIKTKNKKPSIRRFFNIKSPV